MEKKPFAFFTSFLKYIDEGNFFRRPVQWLYIIFAVLNALTPLFMLITAIQNDMFKMPGKYIAAFIIAWIVSLVGFLLLAMLWWNRKNQISLTAVKDSAFPVTPVFAHFFRTIGEWFGLFVGGVCFAVLLIAFVFIGNDLAYSYPFGGSMPIGGGLVNILMMPIAGFLIILITRFISEQIKVLVAIADNTGKK